MTETQIIKIDSAITKAFEINIQEVQAMVKEYQTFSLIPNDKESYQLCQTTLTSCVRTRTGINKRRLELNKDDQARIKKRNKAADQLISIIAPAENHLSGLINAEKERLQAIKDEEARLEKIKIGDRIKELMAVNCVMAFMDVATLTDEEYDTLLFDKTEEYKAEQERLKEEAEAKAKAEAEAEAARKAEKERLAKQKAEQEAEAARLAKIKAEQDAEQAAKEAELQKQADELAAQQKAIQKEKDRIAREEAEKKAAEEAKIQAEKEAEERKIKAAEEEKRQEALKPDKEKLTTWLKNWFLPPAYPELKDDEAINLFDNILLDIENVFKFQIQRVKDL